MLIDLHLDVVKGHLPVHNSMDALAAAALSYGCEEGPKLVSFKGLLSILDYTS